MTCINGQILAASDISIRSVHGQNIHGHAQSFNVYSAPRCGTKPSSSSWPAGAIYGWKHLPNIESSTMVMVNAPLLDLQRLKRMGPSHGLSIRELPSAPIETPVDGFTRHTCRSS